MTDPKPEMKGLEGAYDLGSSEAARDFYARWAESYDAELGENGYVMPERCAKALAAAAPNTADPLVEFGCGTGLGGLALRAAGFTTIDGFDLSQEMLARAAGKGVYRQLDTIDLSKPLELGDGAYANAAAIGVVNPQYMPATVVDEMLKTVRPGGCLVFSLNDHSAAHGSVQGRVMDLTDTCAADLVLAERGPHIAGTGLQGIVYVLRRR